MLLILPCFKKTSDFVACKPQRHRPAWASPQSGQHLCYSLIGKNTILTGFLQKFNIQSSLCSWADSETQKTGFSQQSTIGPCHKTIWFCGLQPDKTQSSLYLRPVQLQSVTRKLRLCMYCKTQLNTYISWVLLFGAGISKNYQNMRPRNTASNSVHNKQQMDTYP